MTFYGYKLPALSSLILWALLWEVVGRLGLTFFIPPFSEVVATLVGLVPTKAFLNALWVTAYAFLAGVFFAIVIGIPIGILMGKNRIIDELLLPWVNIFLSAPLTALVPVLMVLFGFGTKTVIITTTQGCGRSTGRWSKWHAASAHRRWMPSSRSTSGPRCQRSWAASASG